MKACDELGFVTCKPGQTVFGFPIGIIVLDTHIPFIPGDVGNATTFRFPVLYKSVQGATSHRMVKVGDRSMVPAFIEAAQELEASGVRAVTGDCGFMALFQREIADAVEVPVFMSSLLQVPLVHRMLKRGQKVGILTADRSSLTPAHFEAVGVTPDMPVCIRGMENKREFPAVFLHDKSTMDCAVVRQEVMDVAEELVREESNVGALVLECSDMPPYGRAIQDRLGLPVFDFVTLINWVWQGVVKTEYVGHL